ncbi:MAG: hypothetical protein JXR73_21595 [Candidatus Omnitrophica bacterium]|nr:hypothetical protein [Candidatus Omnitrophota bacterium]
MIRILIVIAIALLSFNPSTVIAQESAPPTLSEAPPMQSAFGEQVDANPAEPFFPIAQASVSAPQKDQATRIFKVKSDNLNAMVQILQQVFPSAKVIADERSNSLIVVSALDELNKINDIIRTLDGDSPEAPTPLPNNIAYRVYAIEAPVEIQAKNMLQQDFFARLSIPGENVITNLPQLEQSLKGDFMIEKLECNFSGKTESRSPSSPGAGLVDVDKKEEPRVYSEIMIQGQASSPAILQELIETIEQSVGAKVDVKSMQFIARHADEMEQSSRADNLFYERLEEMLEGTESDSASSSLKSLKKTLNIVLGDELQVRGYWFGASSLPGVCKVPIGPWVLEIQSQKSDDHVMYGMGMMGGMGGYGGRAEYGGRGEYGGMGGYGMGSSNDMGKNSSKGASGGMGGSSSSRGAGGGMMGGMGMMGNMGGGGVMMGGMGGMGGMGIGMKPSSHSNEFKLEINLTENDKIILANSVNARLGRPVIVGYTRQVSGHDATGALVIIPEAELPAN